MRRRGYPAAALRAFCSHIGVARVNGTHEIELLESFVRDELNRVAERRMGVLRPLRVVLTNWPDGLVEHRDAVNNPEDPDGGTRAIPMSGELWIEQEDFMLDPPPKYYRLTPGREVRLRYGYFVTCTDVETDADGRPVTVYCTYDPATAGGQAPDGRKVKSTIHWVSVAHALDGTAVLYDRLFTDPFPESHDDVDPLSFLNPGSREVLHGVKLEPGFADIAPGGYVQFERLAYFALDPDTPLLFHRTVGLRDEWARIQRRG
jgi:glutaminyl-tRNA synthetase